LLLACNPYKCASINGEFIVVAARACLHLRTFSCQSLHIGTRDSFLKSFLTMCNNVVNLDLNQHYDLTDNVLIEAVSALRSLQSLSLQGCCRLTDKTLYFLTQRFASTLKVLYLDHSVFPKHHRVDAEIDAAGNPVMREEVLGGYTAAGVTSLRAQCTHLHTFHFSIQAGWSTQTQHVDAFKCATIVHLSSPWEKVADLILEHCDQMEVLSMSFDYYTCNEVCLTADQLMTVAARFPKLRMVVGEEIGFGEDEDEVDYSAVRGAFPKLMFAKDLAVGCYDALKMPI